MEHTEVRFNSSLIGLNGLLHWLLFTGWKERCSGGLSPHCWIPTITNSYPHLTCTNAYYIRSSINHIYLTAQLNTTTTFRGINECLKNRSIEQRFGSSGKPKDEGQHSQSKTSSLKNTQLKRILGKTLTWFVTDSLAFAGLTKNNPTMVSQDILIELDSSGLFFPPLPWLWVCLLFLCPFWFSTADRESNYL